MPGARRADYAFFLALGLTLLVSAELLLISGGILDLFPLSGVATPFLSYGRTAMLANFAIAGILLALGRRRRQRGAHGALSTRDCAGWRLVLGALVLDRGRQSGVCSAGAARTIAGQGTLVLEADGGRRYVYNPRLIAAARTLQRGTIYDRTGLAARDQQLGGTGAASHTIREARESISTGPATAPIRASIRWAAYVPSAGRHTHARQLERAQQFAGRAR